MTRDEYQTIHGCGACRNAGTMLSGSAIMPALTSAQNEQRKAQGKWGYCVRFSKTVDSSDGKSCGSFIPDHDL